MIPNKYLNLPAKVLPVLMALLSCPSGMLHAQEDVNPEEACAFTLREATNLYNQGLIEDVPSMLQDCISEGFTREERLEAYKLIIFCHLFDDNLDQANREMLEFLRKYPEYEATPTDPVEFVHLLESYDTQHKFTYGVYVGPNLSHGTIAEPFSVLNLAESDNPLYEFSGVGITAGARLNFLLIQNLELSVEPGFSMSSFAYNSGEMFGINTLDYQETHMRIELPASFTYELNLGNWRPYLRAGATGGYLLSATASATRSYRGSERNDVTVPDVDMLPLRREINVWALTALGVKFKIPKGYIVLDARYHIGLLGQNNPSGNRYNATPQIEDLNFQTFYTDDDFGLNNVLINIGYLRSFYRPKKIMQQ